MDELCLFMLEGFMEDRISEWWTRNLVEEISMQNIEGAVWLLLTACSKTWKEINDLKMEFIDRALWLTPVIPALWEAQMGGLQGQEFETSLANMAETPYLKKN